MLLVCDHIFASIITLLLLLLLMILLSLLLLLDWTMLNDGPLISWKEVDNYLTNSLTNFLTNSCVNNHSWNSNSFPNKQEISRNLWSLSVHDRVYMCPTLESSWVRLTQSTPFLLTARWVLIFFYHLCRDIPSRPFPFMPFPCIRYALMLRPSQSPWFDYRHSIWWDVYVHTYVHKHIYIHMYVCF